MSLLIKQVHFLVEVLNKGLRCRSVHDCKFLFSLDDVLGVEQIENQDCPQRNNNVIGVCHGDLHSSIFLVKLIL